VSRGGAGHRRRTALFRTTLFCSRARADMSKVALDAEDESFLMSEVALGEEEDEARRGSRLVVSVIPHLDVSSADALCGGLVFKAHRLVYHSTLGLRVIQKRCRWGGWGLGLAICGWGEEFRSRVQGFGALGSGSRGAGFRVQGVRHQCRFLCAPTLGFATHMREASAPRA